MEFLLPYRLVWLAILAPLIWFLVRAERVRIARLAALAAPTPFDFKRVIFPVISTALLLTALARPYSGYRDIQLETEGHDVVVAVDVSFSMMAADASPNRLENAKRKIFDLIDAANRMEIPLRIGLVTFAGSAFRYCPITSDLEIVRAFAESISPDVMTSRGSSLESAVDVSIQVLAQVKSQHGTVILLTDGEDLQFSIASVEGTLKKSGVPIYPIGIGGADGAPIPRGDGRYFTSNQSDIVITKLLEGPLQELASASGGMYQRSDITGRDISNILARSGSVRGGEKSIKTIRSYHEIGSWFAAPILLLTALLIVLRRESILFSLLLLLALSAAGPERSWAQDGPIPSPREAYDAYQQGDYEKALRGFAAEHQRSPQDSAVAQSLGSALFRLKKYDEAAKVFDSLAAGSRSGRERFEALYDSANSHLMKQDFDGAITRYEKALSIKPEDIPATSNLALAKRLKEEKQQQEQQSQSSDSSSSQSSSNSSKNEKQDGNPSSNSESSSSESSSGDQGDSSSSDKSSGQSSSASDSSSSNGGQESSGEQNSTSSTGGSSSGDSSSDGSSSQAEESSSESSQGPDSASSANGVPTPSARPTIDPLKALDNLEDRPLLPKQRRNRDTEPLTGQTW